MFCENCGGKLPDNAQFCEICGAKVATAVQTHPAQVQPVQTEQIRPGSAGKKRAVWPIVVITLALLVVAAVIGVIAVKVLNKGQEAPPDNIPAVTGNEDGENDGNEIVVPEKNPEIDNSITAEEAYGMPELSVAYPDPEFLTVTASDTLIEENYDHSPELIMDGRTDTAWAVTDGVGEWIMILADSNQYVSGIKVLNGYNRHSPTTGTNLYYANCRPREITIEFSDGTYVEAELEDEEGLFQEIDFGQIKETNFIKITVNSVYSGTRWADMCISEIQVY